MKRSLKRWFQTQKNKVLQIRSRRFRWITTANPFTETFPMPSQNWSFGSDGDKTLIHTPGLNARVMRMIDNAHPMVEGALYKVMVTIGGTISTVTVVLGGGTGSSGDATQIYAAGAGAVEFTAAWINAGGVLNNSIISFIPGTTSDVIISNISVTKI